MLPILMRTIALITFCIPLALHSATPNQWKLESTVIVSRHGVRAPTKLTPVMREVTPYQWPQWDVPLGWLTPRGGTLVSYMGQYQRLRLAKLGLLAEKGCPGTGEVAVIADIDQRTRKTGEAFLSGLAPSCSLPVHVQQNTEQVDPLFNPIKAGVCRPDEAKVKAAILARAGGSLEQFTQRYQPAFAELERVLNFPLSALCRAEEQKGKACSLVAALPPVLSINKDGVSLSGSLALASTLTEIFLLQQAQGMPRVGWGRIFGAQEWRTLLNLHNAQFMLLQRTPEVARSRATPLLDLILLALTAEKTGRSSQGIPLPSSLLFIAGHDTNLANIGGALDLNWTLPDQPDNTPPAGELVFERWQRLRDGSEWVRVSIVYQTLQQMRDITPLSLASPPGVVELTIPACNEANEQRMCSLARFRQLIDTVRDADCAI